MQEIPEQADVDLRIRCESDMLFGEFDEVVCVVCGEVLLAAP